MMFNYEAIAKRINLPEERLSEIGKIIRKDFPRDEMMFELHMLRVLMALERKDLTLSEYFLTETEKLSPTKAEEPYYWRVKAIDGASNESDWSDPGSFYVSASRFTLGAPARNALIAVGVTAGVFFGFWLGRRTSYSKV